MINEWITNSLKGVSDHDTPAKATELLGIITTVSGLCESADSGEAQAQRDYDRAIEVAEKRRQATLDSAEKAREKAIELVRHHGLPPEHFALEIPEIETDHSDADAEAVPSLPKPEGNDQSSD